MKTAIRFFTRSKKGNTQKLADAVSEAIGNEAIDVSVDLTEKVDRLFLINAMYAADIDKEVKQFLERNKDNIGEIINMNTSCSGASTLGAVKKTTDKLGITLSDKEFHCAASWIFINKGLPSADDYKRAQEFAKALMSAFQSTRVRSCLSLIQQQDAASHLTMSHWSRCIKISRIKVWRSLIFLAISSLIRHRELRKRSMNSAH